MSFAKKAIEEGDYEDAVTAATKDIEEGNAGPEPLFDRGTALELLERFGEAVKDFEAAIERNSASKELDPFALDDAYFSALLGAAREAKDAKLLESYAKLLPSGAHLTEASDWQKRLRGEMPSLLDKTKDIGAD
jgi:tetratricopeptide (TPR) repeat protein